MELTSLECKFFWSHGKTKINLHLVKLITLVLIQTHLRPCQTAMMERFMIMVHGL